MEYFPFDPKSYLQGVMASERVQHDRMMAAHRRQAEIRKRAVPRFLAEIERTLSHLRAKQVEIKRKSLGNADQQGPRIEVLELQVLEMLWKRKLLDELRDDRNPMGLPYMQGTSDEFQASLRKLEAELRALSPSYPGSETVQGPIDAYCIRLWEWAAKRDNEVRVALSETLEDATREFGKGNSWAESSLPWERRQYVRAMKVYWEKESPQRRHGLLFDLRKDLAEFNHLPQIGMNEVILKLRSRDSRWWHLPQADTKP